MTERKYSVAEINRMRLACRALWVCSLGTTSFLLEQQREEAEDMLRTYLMANIDPDELCFEAKEAQEKYDRAMDRYRQESREVAVKFAEKFEPSKFRWWHPFFGRNQ
jgi:hypothetical protein